MGELKLPIFKEAQFRGDADVAEAQQADTLNRQADLKQQIDQQLRDSMLDLNSSQALVRVSQQNVDLATHALSDANDRFAAGVDDNLPVVQAQATLVAGTIAAHLGHAQLQPGKAWAGPQSGHRGHTVQNLPARQVGQAATGSLQPRRAITIEITSMIATMAAHAVHPPSLQTRLGATPATVPPM